MLAEGMELLHEVSGEDGSMIDLDKGVELPRGLSYEGRILDDGCMNIGTSRLGRPLLKT